MAAASSRSASSGRSLVMFEAAVAPNERSHTVPLELIRPGGHTDRQQLHPRRGKRPAGPAELKTSRIAPAPDRDEQRGLDRAAGRKTLRSPDAASRDRRRPGPRRVVGSLAEYLAGVALLALGTLLLFGGSSASTSSPPASASGCCACRSPGRSCSSPPRCCSQSNSAGASEPASANASANTPSEPSDSPWSRSAPIAAEIT